MTIGERIKQRRMELGLSQDELSRKMGYQTRNAIYQFEKKDNMKLSLIEKFAEALDTTPAYLMGWEDEQGNETPYEQLIDAYVMRDRMAKYSQEDIIRALDFLDALEKATPEARAAIEILLKSHRPDS